MTPEQAIDRIREYIVRVSDLYNRLVLIVGSPRSGKTTVLRAIGLAENAPVVSVGWQISQCLLDLTERQRVLQLPTILQEAINCLPAEITLLDNTEVLFSPVLKQDPLRLLQRISRDRTVITSWLGSVVDGHLTYAVPDHPEFRRYRTEELLVVTLDDCSDKVAQG